LENRFPHRRRPCFGLALGGKVYISQLNLITYNIPRAWPNVKPFISDHGTVQDYFPASTVGEKLFSTRSSTQCQLIIVSRHQLPTQRTTQKSYHEQEIRRCEIKSHNADPVIQSTIVHHAILPSKHARARLFCTVVGLYCSENTSSGGLVIEAGLTCFSADMQLHISPHVA
jgi:hypothetical protein